MKKNLSSFIRISALVMLIAVTAWSLFSCAPAEKAAETGAEITITVAVTGKSGQTVEHVIQTTRTNLGDALLDAGIADGQRDQYGLYITAVDGEAADYAVDHAFWSLEQDGAMLMTGASDTPIADGDRFELVYTIS